MAIQTTIEVLRIPGTLFPRGAFDENASYKFLNIVESGGSGYVCLQPCTGIPVTNTAYWFKFCFKGDKGDAFTYADLTAEQKAELVRDATAAAQAAASSAQSAADDAAAALQKFNTIKAAIDAIDPQSTEGSIQTLAAKQGLLEADLNALGPKIDQNTTNIANLQQAIDEITPIIIEGDVTNAPDEEDITSDANDLLKLKDRSTAVNQKGYKILRKGASLASQMVDANTIYEVRYAFDLNGSTLTIPNGCVLKFNGGKISNGTLDGYININAGLTHILDSVSLVGVLINPNFYAEWFGISTANEDNSTILNALSVAGGENYSRQMVLLFGRGVYRFKSTLTLGSISLVGVRKTIPMESAAQTSLDYAKDATIFQYLPNDYGHYIEIDGDFETLQNPQELLESESESVFIQSADSNTHRTNGIVVKNIRFVCGDKIASQSKNDDSYNTICFKYKNAILMNDCIINGFTKCFYSRPTQYSRLNNIYVYGCQIFMYFGFGTDVTTTFEINNCSVTSANYVFKTIPLSSYYTRSGITDLTLRNFTVQGCYNFVLNYDCQIANLNTYNTYYEANVHNNESHCLSRFLLSDYCANGLNNNTLTTQFPRFSEIDAFCNSDRNVFYIEFGILSLVGGFYSGNGIIDIGSNKLNNSAHIAITGSNCDFYYNPFVNIETVQSNIRNISFSRCAFRPVGSQTNFANNIGALTLGYAAAQSATLRHTSETGAVAEFYVNGSFPMKILNKGIQIGGIYDSQVAMNGNNTLENSLGVQLLTDAVIKAESISDDAFSFGGAAIRARRVLYSSTKYANQVFLELDYINKYPFVKKNLRREIIQTTAQRDLTSIQGYIGSPYAYYREFQGISFNCTNDLGEYTLFENKLFVTERLPYGTPKLGDSLPKLAGLREGFVFFNTSDASVNILTSVGTAITKGVIFSLASGVSSVSGNLVISIGGSDITISLTNATLDDVKRAVVSNTANRNELWRFFINKDGNLSIASTLCQASQSDVVNSFVTSSVQCPTGLSVSVATWINGTAHTWEKLHINDKGNSSSRPSEMPTGCSYFDTTLGKPIWWDGTNWIESDKEVAGISRSGTFAQKPTPANVGFQYFCTSGASIDGGTTEKTNIVIYYTGSGWVDANGNAVVAKA